MRKKRKKKRVPCTYNIVNEKELIQNSDLPTADDNECGDLDRTYQKTIKNNGTSRDRTSDLANFNRTLSQLSYRPIGMESVVWVGTMKQT